MKNETSFVHLGLSNTPQHSLPPFVAVKEVNLAPHHVQPHSVGATIHAGGTVYPRTPFTKLQIVQYEGEESCYIFHFAANGDSTDTFHDSIEDAFRSAEDLYGVNENEWSEINSPFGSDSAASEKVTAGNRDAEALKRARRYFRAFMIAGIACPIVGAILGRIFREDNGSIFTGGPGPLILMEYGIIGVLLAAVPFFACAFVARKKLLKRGDPTWFWGGALTGGSMLSIAQSLALWSNLEFLILTLSPWQLLLRESKMAIVLRHPIVLLWSAGPLIVFQVGAMLLGGGIGLLLDLVIRHFRQRKPV